jgi:hypothetical protein
MRPALVQFSKCLQPLAAAAARPAGRWLRPPRLYVPRCRVCLRPDLFL